MKRKLLRALLASATVLVVWLVVAPSTAFAMPNSGAPVCDVRGATMFAPPIQIQDAEVSFDIPLDCLDLGPVDLRLVKTATPGHRAPPDLSSSQEPAASIAALDLDLVFSARVSAPIAVTTAPPPGVRGSLDRPPRG